MVKKTARLGALVLLAGLMGCYTAPVMPPSGNIYSNIASPMDTDADGLGAGAKSGKASSTSILGLIAWGDCSLDTAASAGGIATVNQVDYEFFNVLGIYQKFTTVAHGD